jgi:hypothetical protein
MLEEPPELFFLLVRLVNKFGTENKTKKGNEG